MKPRFLVIPILFACALLCASLSASAQSDLVTIKVTGVKNTSVQALGDYAGYYTGTVGGVASTPGFICDDYKDVVYAGETWTARAISFASIATSATALSQTSFGATIGVNGYAALAYLANLMSTTAASGQGAISAAIWYIGSLSSASSTGNYNSALKMYDSISWSSLSATAQAYVTSLLGSGMFGAVGGSSTTATTYLTSSACSNMWLYVPTSWTGSRPQEFIGFVPVNVPEGGANWIYLLLAGLACSGAFYLKRGKLALAANTRN